MKKLPLHVKIMIGLVAGIIWAFASSAMGWNQFTIDWVDPFGQIFIRMLKYIAVPLVLFSIISGISGLKDMSKLGRMGGKTLGFYLVTTVAAVGIGLLLVNVVKPGALVDEESRIKNRLSYEAWANSNGIEILDGKNFTNDPAYASYDRAEEMTEAQKKMVADKQAAASENKDAGPLKFLVDMVPQNIMLSLSNDKLMLQVIFFGIFFGICMAALPDDKVAGLSAFVNGANEVFLKMVDFVMKAAPFFVFCLLAGVVAKMADTPGEVFEIFKGLASYSVTLVVGLLFLIFVFYPTIVRGFVKSLTYRKFFKKIAPAQFLAFSTSSSAATLPVTMEVVEDNLGVSKNVSSFVLPIGATVNMDGTSLYQAVAVVFMAQLHMVDLSITQQLTIVLTATLASIGSAAVPSAGLVMMVVVLQSVGLNPAWIAIIFPVDRPLDMLRTVVNVTGDTTVSTIVAKSEGELRED
ncbi:dicarboxylate/amino acid:cation symporter [Roseivirga sp. E12]|uniref:dicarboxylate/amino acid:cation symporter n=1 Tax=Roseivirga sp. E12 TaxID=2819237 RepID=UPI001ABC7780|nr:dicarboxylate/amino acid:cation symporter [Roseivirga sp. E12]MBO3699339.1 dicarboxylate/amino acid:cation symporter [Roseivirga sp. E12]